jgi:hypothetical protein
VFGARANIGGSFGDLWERSVDMVYPSQATVASVVSSSANDGAAGTGAQRLRLVGWNSSWQLDEDQLEMNGTTTVTGTVKFWRIISARVVRVGSTGKNAGSITVNLDTQVAAVVSINDNRSIGGQFTIPPSKTGIVLNFFATAAMGGGQIDWGGARIYARFDVSGPFFPMNEVILGGSGPGPSVVPRLVLSGPADISVRAFASGAGGNKRCAAGYDVVLLPEEHRVRRVVPF